MRIRLLGIGGLGMIMLGSTLLWGCGNSDTSIDEASTGTAEAPVTVASSQPAPAESVTPTGGYAPKLVMPSKRPDHVEVPLAAMVLKNAQIPAASDVNIPAYPGARILSTMAGGAMQSSSGTAKSLPAMILLTQDSLDSVLAFYKQKLTGWQYQDFYGVHSIWNGPEGSSPMDIMAGHSQVMLSAIEEGEVQRLLWPEMRTKIDIVYDKPGP